MTKICLARTDLREVFARVDLLTFTNRVKDVQTRHPVGGHNFRGSFLLSIPCSIGSLARRYCHLRSAYRCCWRRARSQPAGAFPFLLREGGVVHGKRYHDRDALSRGVSWTLGLSFAHLV